MIARVFSAWSLSTYVGMGVALVAGCALALGVELWWVTITPAQMEIRSIKILDGPGGSHKIVLENRAPANKSCLRMTQHLLYREANPEDPDRLVREYAPLSNVLTGLGFQGVENYEVELRVPSGIDKGEWMFATRSVFLCSVFPGLMTVAQFTTPPRLVELR